MSLRPEPVTSKFRRYYQKEIFPTNNNFNFNADSSSSAGSTTSLTSILNHENFKEIPDELNYDSFDDLSLHSNDINFSNLSQKRMHNMDQNDFTNRYIRNSKNKTGITREIINSSNVKDIKSTINRNGKFQPLEKSCKRIIARKPDYPGSRITHVNYNEVVCDNKSKKKLSSKSNNNNKKNPICKTIEPKNPITKKMNDFVADDEQIVCKRISKNNLNKDKDNDVSVKNGSEKSDYNYSVCDFTSVSDDQLDHGKISGGKSLDENHMSSVEDSNSITIDEASSVTEANSNIKRPVRILTAWEDWYLKKEEQDRKILERERKNLLSEENRRKELEIFKEKRKEINQTKINMWLKKKEEERKKTVLKHKQEKRKQELEEFKKDDTLKKSSEQYIFWKLKKLELEKEREREEKDKIIKLDADKMIKQAKAQNAFKQWIDEHRDHHMPVPYSYGISDGKLTSYYDKTSNPPPAYFNPKAWIPTIEMKP